ncbi:ABC transporter ATP-binding protein [Pseudoroseicyclus aestuarii]|uniref:Putative ABC transport system ATP-binding protein n=1 Tax=Pseudoroseicyclus aestuarii TaxID=1795041 RepID=A0A318T2G1_9RHOB|nr:ATP-binding cassette domain-containing protein [Pseudoroseicyclus aestuarii]PYE84404.1 putative ABC transport system ATP-binding protein [Pseudoroseicyclus aestuarii]
MAEALALTDVAFRWPGRAGFGLSVPGWRVAAGARLLLLGESGSGKSTLLSLICGINRPDRGRVEVDGTDLGALGSTRRDRVRAERIGVVFQQFNLLPYASPTDNICLPLRFAPERRQRAEAAGRGGARAEARRLMTALKLPEEAIDAPRAGLLSVGQQQRIAVARALIGAPPLLIADEPTSALDAGSQDAFLDLLFTQCEAAGTTLIMVSHDDRLAPRFDDAIRLEDIATIQRTGFAA